MKIAVQFFGHLRTFMDCYNSINENLLNRYDADVFIYTWDSLDHNTKTWHQFHLANNSTLDKDILAECLKTKYKNIKLIKIEHQITSSNGFIVSQGKQIAKSGIINMINSMFRVNRLRQWYQKINKIQYDAVIFIRPDIKILTPFVFDRLDNKSFYTAGFFKRKTKELDFKHIGATDVYFYAKSEVIDKIFSSPDEMKKQMIDKATSQYGPEYSFVFYIQSQGITVNYNNLLLGRDFDILRFFNNKIVSFDKSKVYRKIGSHNILEDIINVPKITPKVSVIVPVYNVSKYVEACLNSILKSTLKEIEIICVDDGSSDVSGLICNSFANKHPNISSYHKDNGGLSDARNYGVKKANGEFICFVDSDDIVSPDMLEKLYKACLIDNTLVAIANFTIWNPISKTRRYIKDLNIDKVFIGPNGKYSPMHLNDCYHHLAWRKIYHRSLFDKIYNPVGIYHEDVGFWYAVLATCDRISIVSFCLYLYRRDPLRTTISNNKEIEKLRKFDFLRSYEFALNKINQLCEASRKDELSLALLTDFLKMPFDLNSAEFYERKKNFLSNFIYLKSKLDNKLQARFDYYMYSDLRHLQYNFNIFKKPFLRIKNFFKNKIILPIYDYLKNLFIKVITLLNQYFNHSFIWIKSLGGTILYSFRYFLRRFVKNV